MSPVMAGTGIERRGVLFVTAVVLALVFAGAAFDTIPAFAGVVVLSRRFQAMQRARCFFAREPLADGFAGIGRAKLSDGQIVWRQWKEELHAHLRAVAAACK